MNITKFLNKVYFAPRLKEIEQYTSHAGELQQLVPVSYTHLTLPTIA